MRSRIFFKLFLAAVALIAIATITLDVAIRRSWEASLRADIEHTLTQEAQLASLRIASARTADVRRLAAAAAQAAATRVTVILRDGTVVADSEADPATMENHATRPEFVEALHGRTGSNVRRSRTLGVDFLYVAVPIQDGALRLAYPLASVQTALAQVRSTLLQASLLALLVSLLFAAAAAQRIAVRLQRIMRFAERVADGDLAARVEERAGDEIGQLSAALDRTARTLEGNFVAIENSRSQLRALLDSMEEGVAAISQESSLVWANGALRRLLPVREGAPLVETLRDPNVLAVVAETLRSREMRIAIARSLAPGRSFQVTTGPMPGIGAVVVLHDITEIERVEKTRRDFIANVSHELRTPLTSILGYTETLLDGGTQHEFLEVIQRNAARMSRLTEDLLTLARVESGEQKLTLESVPPAEAIAEAAAAFKAHADATGVTIETQIGEVPDVKADRDALQQVLANLIENALRYAAEGKRLLIGAARVDGDVEFFVRDFGPGIASEHLPRLFERFYRVNRDRSRQTGGTGLGLAIVKHIVLNHGGSVRAESRLGSGCTFYFTLPLVPAGDHSLAAKPEKLTAL